MVMLGGWEAFQIFKNAQNSIITVRVDNRKWGEQVLQEKKTSERKMMEKSIFLELKSDGSIFVP